MKPLLPLLITLWISQATCQDHKDLRSRMVRKQIEARGINHRPTLEAMRKVERHLFVPVQVQKQAYDDTALPIGYGQTISQPFIVAKMTQLLDPKADDIVLEVGTGSGYQAAVLAEIVDEVYTIEIVKPLGAKTKKLLTDLGYDNVHAIIGDGYKGLPAKAPFDAIIVTAAATAVPEPLLGQLKDGGKMIIPIGPPNTVQTLTLIEKRNGQIITTNVTDVLFVPFTREKE